MKKDGFNFVIKELWSSYVLRHFQLKRKLVNALFWTNYVTVTISEYTI